MAALPDIPGLVRVAVHGTLPNSKKWANVFHCSYTPGDLTQAQADAFVAHFRTAYGNFQTVISGAVGVNEIVLTDLADVTGVTAVDTTAFSGAHSGDMEPPNVCYLVSWKIARRYRGGHSRTYIPGAIADQVDAGGALVSGTLGALQTAADAFLADLDGVSVPFATSKLMVPHYTLNGVRVSVPEVDQVTAAKASPLIATQRRRVR